MIQTSRLVDERPGVWAGDCPPLGLATGRSPGGQRLGFRWLMRWIEFHESHLTKMA